MACSSFTLIDYLPKYICIVLSYIQLQLEHLIDAHAVFIRPLIRALNCVLEMRLQYVSHANPLLRIDFVFFRYYTFFKITSWKSSHSWVTSSQHFEEFALADEITLSLTVLMYFVFSVQILCKGVNENYHRCVQLCADFYRVYSTYMLFCKMLHIFSFRCRPIGDSNS